MPKKFKDIGLNWLSQKNPFFVIMSGQLANSNSEYFFQAYLDENVCAQMDPSDWWKAVSNSALPEGLVDLASTICSLPSSTGSLERCFSSLSNIITKKRSKLGLERASQLCSVHQSLVYEIESDKVARGINKRKGVKRSFPFPMEDDPSLESESD